MDCPHCGFKLNSPTDVCPNCGNPLSHPIHPESASTSVIQRFFQDAWMIITRPNRFFREMPTADSLGYPLAFALICHWIGKALSFLWSTWMTGFLNLQGNVYWQTVLKQMDDEDDIDSMGRNAQILSMRERISDWVWGTGSVIADPFTTLLWILFLAFFVHLGARLLVNDRKNVQYGTAVRIVAFGMTPSILAAVPFAGGPVASLLTVVVTVIGAKEVYRIDRKSVV